MKQVAQFKLTGIERIAGLHSAKQKNQRRLLRDRGVAIPATPTPSVEARQDRQVEQMNRALAGDGRFDLPKLKPADVKPWAGLESLDAFVQRLKNNWGFRNLHEGVRVHDSVISTFADPKPVVEPAGRKWRDFHYTGLVGDARNFRTHAPNAEALSDGFARYVQRKTQAISDQIDAYRELIRAGIPPVNELKHMPPFASGETDQTISRLFGERSYNQTWGSDFNDNRYESFTGATGWYLLGTGNFSAVFGNHDFPDVVLKFGQSGSNSDAAYDYLDWARDHQGYHGIPTVHSLKTYIIDEEYRHTEFYVAILDRLYVPPSTVDGYEHHEAGIIAQFYQLTGESTVPFDWSGRHKGGTFASRSADFDRDPDSMHPQLNIDLFDMAALETWMLMTHGDFHLGSIDLHGANLMETKDGRIQFTDPFA